MMMSEWENRIAAFWQSADDSKVDETLAEMQRLVEELEPTNPLGLFEWASVHDFLGLEPEAIPIYKQALHSGLDGLKREKALIQLASSLRIVGKPAEAVALLESATFSAETEGAAKAFLALAHWDAGNTSKAMSLALLEFYPSGGLYESSIKFYATDLIERDEDNLA
jgi:tetratricopeptide (TPR) repeat protein